MAGLRSRADYEKEMRQLSAKEDACVFCELNPELVISSDYKHWTWIFVDLPYWKYHTALVPKRHILRFHELTPEEVTEFSAITKEIEEKYQEKKLVSEDSKFGIQLLMFWRSRYWTSKKNTQHLHMHFVPEFEGAWNSILDPEAHITNLDVFRT